MAKRCEITGKVPSSGCNVSHANNRTKRRFLPNLQVFSLYSEGLERRFRILASHHGIRTVEHKGGLDAYLLGTAQTKLNSCTLRKARKELIKKVGLPKIPEKRPRYESAKQKRLKDKKAA